MDRKALEDIAREFQIKLYETAVSRGHDSVHLLAELAELYGHAGLHDKGLAVDEILVRRDPGRAAFHYNLACSLCRVGQLDRAFAALHTALDLGFEDLKLMLEDRDLEPLRADGRWAELRRRVGKAE